MLFLCEDLMRRSFLLLIMIVGFQYLYAIDPMDAVKSNIKGNQFEEAERGLRSIITADSTNADALILLGSVLSWKREFSEAELIFNTLLAKDSTRVEAGLGLINCYSWQGEAKKAISKAEELYKKTSDYRYQQRLASLKIQDPNHSKGRQYYRQFQKQKISMKALDMPVIWYFETGVGFADIRNQSDWLSWYQLINWIPTDQFSLGIQQQFLDRYDLNDCNYTIFSNITMAYGIAGLLEYSTAAKPEFSARQRYHVSLFKRLSEGTPLVLSAGYTKQNYNHLSTDMMQLGLDYTTPGQCTYGVRFYETSNSNKKEAYSQAILGDWLLNEKWKLRAQYSWGRELPEYYEKVQWKQEAASQIFYRCNYHWLLQGNASHYWGPNGYHRFEIGGAIRYYW